MITLLSVRCCFINQTDDYRLKPDIHVKKSPSQRAPMPHPCGPAIATGSTKVSGDIRCLGTGEDWVNSGLLVRVAHHDLLTFEDKGTGITDCSPTAGLTSPSSTNVPVLNVGSEPTPNADKVVSDNNSGPRSSLAVKESTLITDGQFMDTVFAKTGLHISLFNKLDEIRLLFRKSKIAVFSFSETWLDSSISDAEIEITNYTVVRKDRNRRGGGVCVYARADIGFHVRTELGHADVEAVWLYILLPKSKPILIGACYRPPEQQNFYELLEET